MAAPLLNDHPFATDLSVSFGTIGLFASAPQLVTDGISTATLSVPLPRNTVVQQFDVIIKATAASATVVQNVAQVRVNPGTQPDIVDQGMAIVVDFGTPRTISAVQVPSGMTILRVTPWIGTSFAPKPAYTVASEASLRDGTRTVTPGPNSSATTVLLPSEIQTERLLVEALGNNTASVLAAQMAVVLPGSPSGLELRLDGGAPVFTHPGPAQIGTDAGLSDQGWNKDGELVVHLGDALAKLTGDPTHVDVATFQVVLASRVPGILGVRTGPTQTLLYVRRLAFGSDTSKDLGFAEEGLIEVPLDTFAPGITVDAAAQIRQVSFSVTGTLPPERVLPPIGPDSAGLADLVVNPNRSSMVRLPSGTGLGEITAIRLPLTAESGGAEMRVALWQSKKGTKGEPSLPTPQGTSDPVQLSQGTTEAWVTFPFKKAVPLDDTVTQWATLLVTRGQVTWALGSSSGALDPIDSNDIRSGPPAGPWLPLPEPFVSGGTPLAHLRGRVRVAGHAKKDAPIAPVLASVAGSAQLQVTPTAKGADVVVTGMGPVPLAAAKLRIISRVAGTISIKNVDVVATK